MTPRSPHGATEPASIARRPIELRGVHKSYVSAVPVLDGLDLTVHRGEIVAVAGRSGSGKTTMLTMIAGWERADSGEVLVLDRSDPASLSWSDLAILPQTLGMLDELTIFENVALPLRLSRRADRAAVEAVLERLGVAYCAKRYPSEVSLGEQQRAAFARAAVCRPAVLIADEPIAHQNSDWAREMMRLLSDLAADGTTSLLATHNEIAFEAAHRIFDLDAGRLHRRQ